MNERLQILKASKSIDRDKLINSSHEIYGACRHKSKFHRYRFYDSTSTDEGPILSPERSELDSVRESLVQVCVPIVETNGNLVVDL